MNTTTIRPEVIKAMLITAAKKDIRAYLQGLYFDKAGAIVSTDGHRLAVFKCVTFSENVLIPRTLLDGLDFGRKAQPVTISIGEDLDSANERAVTISQGSTTIQGRSTGSRFPDWRRVIPKNCTGEVGQFNPNYIADFGKVAQILKDSRMPVIHIAHNGTSGALVTIHENDNYVAVLMPQRSEAGSCGWVYGL